MKTEVREDDWPIKYEYYAELALQGILDNTDILIKLNDEGIARVRQACCVMAMTLVEELNKTEK